MENLDKYAKYYLLDKHYKSDKFTNGRKFKKFFNDFAKKLFELNLNMQKGIGIFSLVYGEKTGYASIAQALHSLTPYVYSEIGLDCKNSKPPIKDKNGKDKKIRSIDFWCQLGKGNEALQVWIEHKYLWLNVSNKANAQFEKTCSKIISRGRKQIRDIKKLKGEGLKIATFAVLVYADKNHIMTNEELESIPEYVEEKLASYQDNRSCMGVLCAVLDLRESIKTSVENSYHKDYGEDEISLYAPFVLLGAIVLE